LELFAEGFLLPDSITIAHPDGITTNVTGINDLGQVVGRYSLVTSTG
jgi:hypothetical protein